MSTPLEGYHFDYLKVYHYNTKHLEGFQIKWIVKGIGNGSLAYGFSKERKKFFVDTECMDKEFIAVVLSAAAPKMAELLLKLEKRNNY